VVRCRRAVLAAATSLGTVACDTTGPLPPAVLVAPTRLTLEDGQTLKLTASLRNPGVSRTVRWSSTNTAVATVDVFGNVTGVTNGSATINVKMVDDSTVSTSVPVTVSGPAVATVVVSPAVVTVFVGLARQLNVVLRASDGRVVRGRRVTWTTPDATIAEVTTAGVVRGRAPGGPITLVATSEGSSATSLVRVAHDAEVCPFVTPLALGVPAVGRLSLGDCEFRDDESYVDVYEFTLTSAATVQIDMASTELDSYLGLFNATGPFIVQDNDAGGGRNARIVAPLAAGRYHIWANTTTGATSGTYTLTVVQQ
jgi:hypothetical protein